VPLHPRNEESLAVEFLHLADKRGPIIALQVSGVVILVLVLIRTLSLVYWYIKLRVLLYVTWQYWICSNNSLTVDSAV
jgi:hypothetical protein